MNLHLPLHETAVHPRTGERIRAIGVLPSGRIVWPIMGGDGTDTGGTDTDTPGGADDKAGGDDKANDAKLGDSGKLDKPGNDDKGFPENTPVASMTLEQQVAYHKHQARKHEQRATAYREAAGGKSADDLKNDLTELGTLRTERMTESEKQVNQAKVEGRREAALTLAPQLFDVALAHVDEERRKVLIDTIDLSKVVSDAGEIDTAKVKSIAESLAPADKDQGNTRQPFDFGGGKRGGTDTTTGVSAGRELFKQRRGKTSTTT